MYTKIILKFTLKYCLFVEIARVCSFYDNLTGNKDISDQIRQTRLPPIYLKLFDTEDLMKMGFEKFQAVLITKHQDGSSVVTIKEEKKKRREQVVRQFLQSAYVNDKQLEYEAGLLIRQETASVSLLDRAIELKAVTKVRIF